MSFHGEWALARGQDSKMRGHSVVPSSWDSGKGRKGTVPRGSGLHQSPMLRKAGPGHCRKSPHKRTQRMEEGSGGHASDIAVHGES